MTTITETNTAKASLKVVALIDELTDVRAEITRLEKIKTALTAEVNEIFDNAGVDTLVHRNIDVARRDWRERSGTDEKKLAEMFPEVYEQTRKTTRYSVLVSLYKKATAKKQNTEIVLQTPDWLRGWSGVFLVGLPFGDFSFFRDKGRFPTS